MALKTLCSREVIISVGNQMGVGKESGKKQITLLRTYILYICIPSHSHLSFSLHDLVEISGMVQIFFLLICTVYIIIWCIKHKQSQVLNI